VVGEKGGEVFEMVLDLGATCFYGCEGGGLGLDVVWRAGFWLVVVVARGKRFGSASARWGRGDGCSEGSRRCGVVWGDCMLVGMILWVIKRRGKASPHGVLG